MVKKIRKKQAAHAELDSYQQQFQNWIFIDFQYHINESLKKSLHFLLGRNFVKRNRKSKFQWKNVVIFKPLFVFFLILKSCIDTGEFFVVLFTDYSVNASGHTYKFWYQKQAMVNQLCVM